VNPVLLSRQSNRKDGQRARKRRIDRSGDGHGGTGRVESSDERNESAISSPVTLEDPEIRLAQVDLEKRGRRLNREPRDHTPGPFFRFGKDGAPSQDNETKGLPSGSDGGPSLGRDDARVSKGMLVIGLDKVARDGEGIEGSDERMGVMQEVFELSMGSVKGMKVDVSNERKG
jgi:hypothetical protein